MECRNSPRYYYYHNHYYYYYYYYYYYHYYYYYCYYYYYYYYDYYYYYYQTWPQVLYNPGEEWRVVSFDEVRCDDKTHGDGGKRHARTERVVTIGKDDDGEVVGNLHGSTTASAVGGSNANYEALPCFMSLACLSVNPAWFRLGPTTTLGGKVIHTDGVCNEKGSVDGIGAVCFLRRGVIRNWTARGEEPTADKKGVLICDGCGTHMTLDFLDWCIANHIILVLRTPNCSQARSNPYLK
jgi:hypothetical protein